MQKVTKHIMFQFHMGTLMHTQKHIHMHQHTRMHKFIHLALTQLRMSQNLNKTVNHVKVQRAKLNLKRCLET